LKSAEANCHPSFRPKVASALKRKSFRVAPENAPRRAAADAQNDSKPAASRASWGDFGYLYLHRETRISSIDFLA
jgi:hypothetical protein